jgi:hypothetical protein
MGKIYFRFPDVRQILVDWYWLIKFGYRPVDLWGADYWIAKKIEPIIRHLSVTDQLMGYPCSLSSQEEWREILTAIADGFQAVLDEDDLEAEDWKEYKAKSEELWEKQEKGLQLFAKYFRHLWD